jgi:hypothetical protein
MSKINDGGPAFAALKVDVWDNPYLAGGMSLRDWFAGQALIGIAIEADLDAKTAAGVAYEHADAMLAARAEGGAE